MSLCNPTVRNTLLYLMNIIDLSKRFCRIPITLTDSSKKWKLLLISLKMKWSNVLRIFSFQATRKDLNCRWQVHDTKLTNKNTKSWMRVKWCTLNTSREYLTKVQLLSGSPIFLIILTMPDPSSRTSFNLKMMIKIQKIPNDKSVNSLVGII